MFRRNKIKFPQNWKIGNHSGYIYKSWSEVPFKKYVQLLEEPDRELEILTGATAEHLKDKQFYAKMDAETNFRAFPIVNKHVRGIVLDKSYVFPDDLDLLSQTTDQFIYIDKLLKPVKVLAEELAEEQAKDNPNAEEVLRITQNQSLNIVKIYPDLIATYINVAYQEEFTGDDMDKHKELINELDCVTILSLGAFFLSSTILLINLKRGLIKQQEYLEEVTRRNRRRLGMMTLRSFGVTLRVWIVWLSGILLRLKTSLNGK